MKYSNTARSLCLIFHALLLAAFGVLGIYFGFFVVPQFFDVRIQHSFDAYVAGLPFNLYLELAVIGLIIFTISTYGFVQAIRSILHPNDDGPVLKSFVAFIGEGYVASIFFASQALLFFDLTANKSLPFVIIMALLITIVLLIATNIPMVRLFDGKDQTLLLSGLSFTGAVSFGWLGIETVLSFLGSFIYMSTQRYDGDTFINLQLGITALVSLAIFAMTLIAGLKLKKQGAKDTKALALAGYLTSGSVFLLGSLMLFQGILDLVEKDNTKIHLESSALTFTGYGYCIMGIVLGGLVIVAAVFFLISTINDTQKRLAKA